MTPHRLAVIGTSGQITYRELVARARALAVRLADVPPGAVGILLPPGPSLAVAFLGCAAAGRVALLLNESGPPARTDLILRDAATTAVIGRASAAPAVPGGVLLIDIDGAFPSAAVGWCEPADSDEAATVAFTSGSTGVPKGVMRSHHRMFVQAHADAAVGKIAADDTTLCLFDPSTGSGLSGLALPLILGATQVTAPLLQLGVSRLLRTMADARVTQLSGAPQALATLLRGSGARDATAALERIVVKGDAMLATDLDAIRRNTPPTCSIWHGYGLTETSSVAGWHIPRAYVCRTARVPAGYVTAGIIASVRDEAGQAVAPGEAGELWISSAEPATGQWQAGRIIAAVVAPDPDNAGRRLFRTGDLVRFDPDGLLHVVGRRDRQVKINGVRVDPAEAENALRTAPGVSDTAVLAETDGLASRLVAYVVAATPPDPAFEDALREHLRTRLPSAMHPAQFVFVAQVPRTGTGKVNASELAKQGQQELAQ